MKRFLALVITSFLGATSAFGQSVVVKQDENPSKVERDPLGSLSRFYSRSSPRDTLQADRQLFEKLKQALSAEKFNQPKLQTMRHKN